MTARMRPVFASRAEARRYEATLAKMAYKPAPVYHDSHYAARHAVAPDGAVLVLYYGSGKELSPSASAWLVPNTGEE